MELNALDQFRNSSRSLLRRYHKYAEMWAEHMILYLNLVTYNVHTLCPKLLSLCPVLSQLSVDFQREPCFTYQRLSSPPPPFSSPVYYSVPKYYEVM
jgi:hypothetical protein